jgi:hypothetical protein
LVAIDRIAQQIATGMPGKPRLLVELKTENARTLERAIHATLAWRGTRSRAAATNGLP